MRIPNNTNPAFQKLAKSMRAKQESMSTELCKEMYKTDAKEMEKPWEKWEIFFHGEWIKLNKEPVFHASELYRRIG